MDNSIGPRSKGRAPPPPDLAPGLLMPLRNQLCVFDEGAGAELAGACVSGPRFFDGLAKSSGQSFVLGVAEVFHLHFQIINTIRVSQIILYYYI